MSLTLRLRAACAVLALTLAALAAGSVPASAQADPGTILYIQGGNIWLSTPDGGQRHQVTTTGGWSSPTMADDGTIVAVNGTRELVRLNAAGTIVDSFVPSPQFGSGVSEARVSPDGQYVTYWSIEICPDSNGNIRACFLQAIVHADGREAEAITSVVQVNNGTWLPGNQVALGTFGVETLDLSGAEEQPWFRFSDLEGDNEDGPDDIGSISVDADGELMAILAETYVYNSPDTADDDVFLDGIHFYELNGPPPAEPTRIDCVLADPEGGPFFGSVVLAPAGDAFVVESTTDQTAVDEATTDLLVALDFDPAACDPDFAVLAQGAVDPSWSAAPFDPDAGPGPSPVPPPGGGPAPDQPQVALVDGGRVDGGGSADPVGQAIATSESIWADGGAGLVVLATAERFPDALAGAPLAGELGPILVTPFGPSLDPRVEAEIRRIAGPDTIVLVLGGTNAVSESAAAQARAAAGNDTCPAPYPTGCRYAGAGREATAALVGQTVLERDGSIGRVLLARGDAFADAITGGAYAAEAGVPILLTPSGQLNADSAAFITDNAIGEVIILGGTAAVSDAVAAAVPATTRRIAGADRTATSAAIATELWHAEGLDGGGIVVVNVRDEAGWPAALAAASLSALANAPQLGVETPPAAPGQALLDAAALIGGPVETHASAALVSDAQVEALQGAAG